jgi:hypothetical protein
MVVSPIRALADETIDANAIFKPAGFPYPATGV